ncbi:MAG: hypothetical protein IJH09_01890 [Clostridia bacterium]|nr:hypothetical protein [Clostridia bacterium]
MKNKKLSLLSLSIPILIEQILRSLMGTVNAFMLSRLSDDAAAAVGVANQVLSVVTIGSSMLATGAAVLVNQAIGGHRDRDAADITVNSLLATGVLGLFMSGFTLLFSIQIVTFMGLTGELADYASVYLRIVGGSCVLQFVSGMLNSHFRCRGKAHVVASVILLINLLNLAGSWLVVGGRFFLRGVAGIATVRLIAEAVGLGTLILLFRRENWGFKLRGLIRLNPDWLKQIVRLGFMSGLEGIS